MTIVKCEDVKKYFKASTGIIKAVDGVSLEMEKGDTFGIAGESGCGKTTLGKMILGILKPDSGSVVLGTNRIQVIFQDPYNSLDPKMKIGDILAEGLFIRRSYDIKERVEKILDLIKLPKEALRKYPHQFSGGERQRIAIGRAVITEPELIICDEPVSSLDVTIQLQILNLLRSIQKKLNITYLVISHDLKVIKFMCSRLAVMYSGMIIESASTEQIFSHPSREYTKTLLSSAFYDNIGK